MEEVKEVKKTKKKNKVASLLLALALILTCGVAGTIAQYQKTLTGSSTATVAKFNVSAGDLTNTQKFKLFETVVDTKDAKKDDEVADKKIAPGTEGYFKVTLTNDSEVDVDYQVYANWSTDSANKYKVSYTDSNKQQITDKEIPLEFALVTTTNTTPSYSELNAASWKNISELNLPTSTSTPSAANSTGTLKKDGDADDTKDVFICWRWVFEGKDASTAADNQERIDLDTAVGEQADQLNPMVDVGVKFTQKD